MMQKYSTNVPKYGTSINFYWKMTRLAIFDLDGTLLNTIEDLASACNHALKGCGCPERAAESG